jgi:hypothetical protein
VVTLSTAVSSALASTNIGPLEPRSTSYLTWGLVFGALLAFGVGLYRRLKRDATL